MRRRNLVNPLIFICRFKSSIISIQNSLISIARTKIKIETNVIIGIQTKIRIN